ncbi:MAG: 4Fe-4S binding protein [Leptospiraceae bacterium]|nr:4Fe-4S binding protein [Leptospiraceae bacterium]MCP5502372.1 4Fe-4S binding protein [Leptospiraceae bacterium]
MPYIVTSACIGHKYTDCVTECPVNAFREGDDMLYIHPDVCIDCGVCMPLCPVEAIYPDYDIPLKDKMWIDINRIKADKYPTIFNNRIKRNHNI